MTTETNHPDPAAPGPTCDEKTAEIRLQDMCDYPDAPLPDMPHYRDNVSWHRVPLTIGETHWSDIDWQRVLYRPVTPADGLEKQPWAKFILRDPKEANKRPPDVSTLEKRHEKLRAFARRQREMESYNEVLTRAPEPLQPGTPGDPTEMMERAAAGLASLTEAVVRKACLKEQDHPAELDDEFLARLAEATTLLNRLANVQQKLKPRRPKPGRPRGSIKRINLTKIDHEEA